MNEKGFIDFWKRKTVSREMKEILMLEFINNNIDANHFLAKKTKEFLSSEIKKRKATLA